MSHRDDRPQLTGTPGSMSGMDLDVVDVTVAAGAKSATVRVNTSGDKFWLGGFITSITTQAPDFTDTIKKVKNLTRNDGTVARATRSSTPSPRATWAMTTRATRSSRTRCRPSSSTSLNSIEVNGRR